MNLIILFIATMFWTSLLQLLFNRFMSRRNAVLAANGAFFVIAPVLSMFGHDYDHLDFSYALPQVATFIVLWLAYRRSSLKPVQAA